MPKSILNFAFLIALSSCKIHVQSGFFWKLKDILFTLITIFANLHGHS